ncbi:30S ribosomal protein S4 [Candidatus Bipolaricaulota bacterium]|nr:30S ribosomal protein S4 [Candidatus Bipolaricaulota bacterium]
MGRETGPKCKRCRREGEKLYIKGDRCYSRSCPMSGRGTPPGERAKKRRPRKSQYLLHLREKQKAKRIYGLRERQFRKIVETAKRKKGVTGETILSLLERRFDNTVYRAGFASSRDQARQFITHGHFEINGRATNVPSVTLCEGDLISVKESRQSALRPFAEQNQGRDVPNWLERNAEAMRAQLISLPTAEDTKQTIAANLIVEFYSR